MSESFIDFPPFYTLQPNLETRKVQIKAWESVILEHCRQNRLFILNVNEAIKNSPFKNDNIKRSLDENALRTILNEMIKNDRIEWINESSKQTPTSCLVYWRTVDEWADVVRNWVKSKAISGSICTFYEITSDDRSDSDLKDLDERILVKALQLIEKTGKCTIMKINNDYGVKFM